MRIFYFCLVLIFTSEYSFMYCADHFTYAREASMVKLNQNKTHFEFSNISSEIIETYLYMLPYAIKENENIISHDSEKKVLYVSVEWCDNIMQTYQYTIADIESGEYPRIYPGITSKGTLARYLRFINTIIYEKDIYGKKTVTLLSSEDKNLLSNEEKNLLSNNEDKKKKKYTIKRIGLYSIFFLCGISLMINLYQYYWYKNRTHS